MMRSSLTLGGEALSALASEASATQGEAPKCPFADVVASAYNDTPPAPEAADEALRWTPEAEQRVEQRIPSFVRAMARMGIEKYARERGYREITPQVLDEAKNIFMG
jgi:hypothetical protein